MHIGQHFRFEIIADLQIPDSEIRTALYHVGRRFPVIGIHITDDRFCIGCAVSMPGIQSRSPVIEAGITSAVTPVAEDLVSGYALEICADIKALESNSDRKSIDDFGCRISDNRAVTIRDCSTDIDIFEFQITRKV